MQQETISINDLKRLLNTSVSARRKLQDIYGRMPEATCSRKAHCCAMLPEITLIEALLVYGGLAKANQDLQEKLIKRVVRYFLTNAAEITACPFLEDGGCLIYKVRFLGCRSYGLWSPDYYATMAERSRQAKKMLQDQWANLGITLPKPVIDFQVPYCTDVKIAPGFEITDAILSRTADEVAGISGKFSRADKVFSEKYFADFSFLITSLIFGITGALHMKFAVVRDIVRDNSKTRLENTLADLPIFLRR